jgi:hypothetical protein
VTGYFQGTVDWRWRSHQRGGFDIFIMVQLGRVLVEPRFGYGGRFGNAVAMDGLGNVR